ncbi:GNAT family acetyltransferase [Legionella busanensis]|uniref:GNAT family acetyltransferase n=1 Tax=Legionella busanensis TaxID=190655 RepID=A0A378JJZ4_9GAMM|nr:GNAT family N-acetyltransferase [Legionella busanensis]STX51061.1 GNAT family acetyltransferase [Legionella busanensis]
MTISFRALKNYDFPLLLKWLQTPHVRAWWDSDIDWNLNLIKEKYATYVDGYKESDNSKEPIYAYILEFNQQEIGYIQYYDAHRFINENYLRELPTSLVAIDMYIGEPLALNKGLGSQALVLLMEQFIFPNFAAALVTPDLNNHQAIACYRKAGFNPVYEHKENHELWLLKDKPKL